jgi:hypothetical protein
MNIMKRISTLLFVLISVTFSFKENTEKEMSTDTMSNDDITTSIYPETITKVFDARGGIDNWNKMKTLSFTMEEPDGKEVTTTDLK